MEHRDGRRSPLAVTLALALVVGVAPCVGAQWQSAFRLGSGVYSDARGTLQGSPLHAAARFAFESARLGMNAQGSWIGRSAGVSNPGEALGRVMLRLQSPEVGGWSLLLVPSAEATRLSPLERGGRLSLAAGVSWQLNQVALRGMAGRSSPILGAVPNHTEDFALEVRARLGPTGLAFTSRGTRWQDIGYTQVDTVYYVAGFPFRGSTTRALPQSRGYVDAVASADWWVGFVQVEGHVGVRGLGESALAARWAGVSLLAPLANRVAVVAEARLDPGSPEQGLRARGVSTLGLQVTSASLRKPSRAGRQRDPASRMHVAVASGPDGHRSLVIRNLPGREVEILSDLTDWKPLRLEALGTNAWRASLAIDPGVYHLLVRVDGGEWLTPPALPTARNEFGPVGVLVVKR